MLRLIHVLVSVKLLPKLSSSLRTKQFLPLEALRYGFLVTSYDKSLCGKLTNKVFYLISTLMYVASNDLILYDVSYKGT